MQFRLARPVRLETSPVDGRRVTRAFLGDRELVADAALLGALARLCVGAPLEETALRRLAAEGVLAPGGQQRPPGPFLALRPELGLDLGFTGDLPAGRRSHLEESLALELGVPPAALDAVHRLAAELRAAWIGHLRARTARGRLPDRAAAAAQLARYAGELLVGPAEACFAQGPDGRLVPLWEAPESLPWQPAAARLHAGSAAAWIDLGSWPALARLGRVLGALAGGIDGAAMQALAGAEAAEVAGLLQTLLGNGLLRAPEALPLAPPIAIADGELLLLGHAGVLARVGGATLLFDPWLPQADTWPRPPLAAELPPLDAILLSHHHWDHLDPATLLTLPKSVPVHLPRQGGALVRPRAAELLRGLGFETVREVEPDERLPFGDGAVYAAPLHGEDPTRSGWRGACWLLEHAGRGAAILADAGPDDGGEALLAALRTHAARLGPVGPVLVSARQERVTRIEAGWTALLRPAAEWTEVAGNPDNDAGWLRAVAEAAGGELWTYAEGGSKAYPADTDFCAGEAGSGREALRTEGQAGFEALVAAVGRLRRGAIGDRGRIGGPG